MFLKQIDIANFRGINRLTIHLDQTTILIGENNTGKSTILDAIQLALGSSTTGVRSRFSEHDYHLVTKDSQVSDSKPIEIVLHFSEQSDNEWSTGIQQKLNEVIQFDSANRLSVILRVQCKYDPDTNESVSEWRFLDLNMKQLSADIFQYKKSLQSLVPVFSLKSLRDPDREFRPSSAFWKPFVRSIKMEPDVKSGLESRLADLNQEIIDAHESFGVIENQLADIAKLVPLTGSNPVNIDALSGKVLDILSRARVSLASRTGAWMPVERHGEGTQSLAIICLFVAFLRSKLDEHSEITSPILTLEEPEAHLHPSAASSVTNLLKNPHGQSIIATHSGDLVSHVPVSSLRCLRRKNGKIAVYQVDWNEFKIKEKLAINHHIRTTRGNILFARCWLLVEGMTERLVFEQCALFCNTDLTLEGVYCVEYAQIGSLRALIKLAKKLGIEWFIVADGDDGGNSYVAKAEKDLDDEVSEARILQLEYTFDVVLCLEGYGQHYESAARIGSTSQTSEKDAVYWKSVVNNMDDRLKTITAASAVDEMRSADHASIPKTVRQIISRAIQLAKGE